MDNPKLRPGRGNWYRYYAGYSRDFADSAVKSLGLPEGSHVLDPWSGSGTTVLASIEQGLRATGIDANPALVVVGRGRLLPVEVRGSLTPIANGILEMAKASGFEPTVDPLRGWFDGPSSNRLRQVEWALQHLLVRHEGYQPLSDRGTIDVSSLAAFFYVALFEVVRDQTRNFRGSNPTWTRSTPTERRSVAWSTISTSFKENVERLSLALPKSSRGAVAARVQTGSSTSLPLVEDAVDAIVTSPPYLTRIDYVVSTLPELAILGYGPDGLRSLRDGMIGTPTIHDSTDTIPDTWAPSVRDVLARVYNHSARASKSYYFKTFRQYFAGMESSFSEIERVIKPGGHVILVAQDSYYKDVHVDLPKLLADVATNRGWDVLDTTSFASNRGFFQLNPHAWKDRATTTTEAVIVLKVGNELSNGH